jgi:hypothetical protein
VSDHEEKLVSRGTSKGLATLSSLKNLEKRWGFVDPGCKNPERVLVKMMSGGAVGVWKRVAPEMYQLAFYDVMSPLDAKTEPGSASEPVDLPPTED